jgi:prophage regulatory protein
MTDRLLKLPEVIQVTGLSKSGIARKEKAGEFPRRIKLGARSVAWSETEINAWVQAIKTARGND